jgi:hypothetical protein
MKGRRAEKRKPMVSISAAGYGGRLPARHSGNLADRRAALSLSISRSPRGSSLRAACVGAEPRVVSQLLAGPHNGPGRSPGAARVPGLRSLTRGTPRLIPLRQRLAKAPFVGRGDGRIIGLGKTGISFSASYRRKPVSSSRQRRERKRLDPGFRRGDASGCAQESLEARHHHTASYGESLCSRFAHWIPAFAGMTGC